MKNYIKALRVKFKKYNIDGYVIPKNDDYFTEYSKINRLKIFGQNEFETLPIITFSTRGSDECQRNQNNTHNLLI